MSEYPRPRMCPEPRCRPIFQIPAPMFLQEEGQPERLRDDPPGESWLCLGVMGESVEFTYDGVEHKNDRNTCSCTPLKGLIRWQESREDWEAMRDAYGMALKRADLRGRKR